MNKNSAHSHPWKISDVVMFPALALAIVLEWFYPTEIGPSRWLLTPIGAVLSIAGYLLIERSKRHLDSYNQPSLPGEPTTRLVTDGPFRFSRNPNYLGAIGIALGLAIAVDSTWFLAITFVCMAILDFWMIRPEEAYLREKFGDEYTAYQLQTRRWI